MPGAAGETEEDFVFCAALWEKGATFLQGWETEALRFVSQPCNRWDTRLCKNRLQELLPGMPPAAALRTGAGTETGIDPLEHWTWPRSLQAGMGYRLFGNKTHLILKIGNICCCLPLWEACLVMPLVARNLPLISGLSLLMANLHSNIFGSDCPSS